MTPAEWMMEFGALLDSGNSKACCSHWTELYLKQAAIHEDPLTDEQRKMLNLSSTFAVSASLLTNRKSLLQDAIR